jgi:hypothetical protein
MSKIDRIEAIAELFDVVDAEQLEVVLHTLRVCGVTREELERAANWLVPS